MGGGLESHCVGRVCGADGAVQHPYCTHDLRSGASVLVQVCTLPLPFIYPK